MRALKVLAYPVALVISWACYWLGHWASLAVNYYGDDDSQALRFWFFLYQNFMCLSSTVQDSVDGDLFFPWCKATPFDVDE